MFERFTEKARRVIFFARYEASVFGSPFIETGHFVLGLVREDRGVFLRLLGQAPTDKDLREKVTALSPPAERTSSSVDLPMSMDVKRCLAYAAEEAEKLEHQHIGTEHMILGLLREDRGGGRQFLGETKTVEEVRAIIRRDPPENSRRALKSVTFPLNLDSTRVIGLAAEEAQQAGVGQIEPEYLLLGLLRDENGTAALILNQLGVTLDAVRRHLQSPPQP